MIRYGCQRRLSGGLGSLTAKLFPAGFPSRTGWTSTKGRGRNALRPSLMAIQHQFPPSSIHSLSSTSNLSSPTSFSRSSKASPRILLIASRQHPVDPFLSLTFFRSSQVPTTSPGGVLSSTFPTYAYNRYRIKDANPTFDSIPHLALPRFRGGCSS
jgi:hypothetical protein